MRQNIVYPERYERPSVKLLTLLDPFYPSRVLEIKESRLKREYKNDI